MLVILNLTRNSNYGIVDNGRRPTSHCSAAAATGSAEGGEDGKGLRKEFTDDEVIQPTVVEVEEIDTATSLGMVLLRANGSA